jgi:hypothetical protein
LKILLAKFREKSKKAYMERKPMRLSPWTKKWYEKTFERVLILVMKRNILQSSPFVALLPLGSQSSLTRAAPTNGAVRKSQFFTNYALDENMNTIIQALMYGLVVILALLPSCCDAQTILSGNISGTWSPSGNPYIISANATVPSGQVLTIQPGVTVWIGQGISISVNGGIRAVGTSTQHITFQPPISSQYWNSISVNNGFTNLFSYCDFANATNALSFAGSSINQVNYCTFINAMGTALAFNDQSSNQVLFSTFQNVSNGIAMVVNHNNWTLDASIVNCLFSNCWGMAVSGVGNGEWGSRNGRIVAAIENSSFSFVGSGCGFSIYGGYYSLGGAAGYGYANVHIENNAFQNVTNTAVLLTAGDYAGSSTATLVNNIILNASNGIVSQDPWDATVMDDIFVGCTSAVTDTGSLSRHVEYNDFFQNATNFIGYTSNYGTVILANRNGTPCDLLFNIYQDPKFLATNDFHLQTNSPAIDAGTPDWVYTDMCFPPAQGASFPDLGIYGGPNACNWLAVVPILPVQATMTHSNQVTKINWGAIPRSEYQVQYLTNLVILGTNEWLNFTNGDVLAAGKPTSLSVATDETKPKMVFRIQSLGRPAGN